MDGIPYRELEADVVLSAPVPRVCDCEGLENGAAKRKRDPINEEFGRRLKEVFKKHDMSMKRVCEVTGLSKTLMNFWANGYKTIRISAFAQIADKVSLTTSEIVYLLEPYWEDEDDG